MSFPRVTVFMPVYNTDEYVGDAIASILKQTFDDIDFLIIDDGSTDSSLSVIKKYAADDSRIRYISRENMGLPATRNEGLDLAIGEYIALMDSDDLSTPDRLQKQVDFLDNNLDITACGTALKCFGEQESYARYEKDPDLIKIKMLFNSEVANATVLFRSDIIRNKALRYSIKDVYAQDYRFWVNALWDGCKLTNIDDVCFMYRIHKQQGSQNHKIAQRNVANDVRQQQFKKLGIYLDSDDMDIIVSSVNKSIYEKSQDIRNLELIFLVYEQLLKSNIEMNVFDQNKLGTYLSTSLINSCISHGYDGFLYYMFNKLPLTISYQNRIRATYMYTQKLIMNLKKK